ncbi:nitroreductase family protein [Microlunatus soli]|uniref:Nitroreductase n=1 Tax=Microlunatus soli TaxID=630515 RepID=A0A1H1R4P3_9ACTN|nr:nitroreductase family protein [Microlunatus soli]SDS30565.1 Nitroreductase [Microlunatus soli]
MEFGEVARRRRMVRDYDPERPLPDGLLDRLVDLGLRAPTAGFTQGVSFLILATAADRERFWAATSDGGEPDSWLRGMRTAPGLVLVLSSAEAYLDRYAEPDKGWTERSTEPWTAPYWFVDAGMAAMAMLYGVVDAGLGGCFFGVPADRVQAVRGSFAIPPDRSVVGVLSVGYPAGGERRSGSPRSRRRRPRTELVRYGRWAETNGNIDDSVTHVTRETGEIGAGGG